MTCSGWCSRGRRPFPPEALRQALKDTRDFFEISHPLAPQDAYLEAIQRKLLLGYQHHGFPEARIEARPDAQGRPDRGEGGGRAALRVRRGQSERAQKVPAAAIIERLIALPRDHPIGAASLRVPGQGPATNPLTQASADESEPP